MTWAQCGLREDIVLLSRAIAALTWKEDEFDGLGLKLFPPSCTGKNSSFDAKQACVLISAPLFNN